MRLIDADKIKPEDYYDRVDMDECMEVINEQPTAYDVEAVVRELESDKYINQGDTTVGVRTHIRISDAVEIVKRGGRNE